MLAGVVNLKVDRHLRIKARVALGRKILAGGERHPIHTGRQRIGGKQVDDPPVFVGNSSGQLFELR
jgi:hypothetical protein